jgi:ADP-ribose diphosphatase
MSRRPGARRLGHEVVFEGRVFRVEHDTVRLPNGRTAVQDVVRHRGSVVLVPQPSAGRVILIRQFRYAIGRWIWELPAGSLEPGEAPARGARRECAEEIGLTPRRLRRLGAFYPTPGFCDERMVVYWCGDLVVPARPAARDPDEQIVPRTFSLDEAWRTVVGGGSIDMKTVLGLILLEQARGRFPKRFLLSGTGRARTRRLPS